MNNTKLSCSLNNTIELRKLILENPDLPLLIFCGEDAWHDEYPYEQADVSKVAIKELTLYENYWLENDEYCENLANDLSNEEEYEDLSEEEYEKMIDVKVAETKFVKAIVIYVG